MNLAYHQLASYTGWIVPAVYVVGWVWFTRVAAVAVARDWEKTRYGEPDLMEKIGPRAIGMMVGLLWPLGLLGMLVTGHLPKTEGQLHQEIADRDARIDELERELKLKP